MMQWYFRLPTGEWGYVQAPSKTLAIKAVKEQHGRKPAHVESR